MNNPDSNPIPSGARAIAALFALCGLYLGIAGLLMLLWPGSISMAAGAPLLFGLELSGPYMFLLMGLAGGGIAWGLMRRVNLVRNVAMIVAIAGVVMLVPSISAATVMVQLGPLIRGGLGIIVRVIVAWYLSQEHIAENFKNARTST